MLELSITTTRLWKMQLPGNLFEVLFEFYSVEVLPVMVAMTVGIKSAKKILEKEIDFSCKKIDFS
jgi:hypothetical protein